MTHNKKIILTYLCYYPLCCCICHMSSVWSWLTRSPHFYFSPPGEDSWGSQTKSTGTWVCQPVWAFGTTPEFSVYRKRSKCRKWSQCCSGDTNICSEESEWNTSTFWRWHTVLKHMLTQQGPHIWIILQSFINLFQGFKDYSRCFYLLLHTIFGYFAYHWIVIIKITHTVVQTNWK